MNLNATLIIEIFSFLILMALLLKFLYRPVLNLLDKRAQEIKELNQGAQERLTLAESKRQEAAQMLSETKQKILQLQDQSCLDAERMRQKIITQAKQEASGILRASEQEIASQTQKAKEKLQAEAIELSLQQAEIILRRKFTPKEQNSLIKELTEQLPHGRAASS